MIKSAAKILQKIMKRKTVINYRPVVFFALAIVAGIFTALLLYRSLVVYVSVGVGFVLLFALLFLKLRKGILLILLIGVCIGYIGFFVEYKTHVVPYNSKYEQIVTAKVYKSTGRRGWYVTYVENLEINGQKVSGRAKFVSETNSPYEGCEVIRGYGKIVAAEPTIGGGDLSVYGSGVYYEIKDLRVDSHVKEYDFFDKIRLRAVGQMSVYASEGDEGIALSLLLGDKNSLDYSDGEAIRTAGLSHVFAVSGLHVGFVTAVIGLLLSRLKKYGLPIIIVYAVALFIYVALCNYPPSALRAAIMALVYLVAFSLKEKPDGLSALALAASLILCFAPHLMFSLSFILSVLAIAGINLFFSAFYRSMRWIHLPRILASSVSLSLSANSLLLPVSACVFGTVGVYFLLSNLIVLPIVTVTYTLILVIAALNLITPYLGFLYSIIGYPIWLIRVIAEFIASLPKAQLEVAVSVPIAVASVIAMLLLSRYVLIKKKTKVLLSASVLCAGFALSFVLYLA